MGWLSSGQRAEILAIVRKQFALPLNGIHGEAHWFRVRENGLRLALETGADIDVVELFALLHDSKRSSNGLDPGHGVRAALFAQELAGYAIDLPADKLQLLCLACREHDAGFTDGDVTVRTCWDADRLDLWRIRIRPDPRRLCTAAARKPETIRWALSRIP